MIKTIPEKKIKFCDRCQRSEDDDINPFKKGGASISQMSSWFQDADGTWHNSGYVFDLCLHCSEDFKGFMKLDI